MIDRRILLASVAGLFGFAALRWLRASPAEASTLTSSIPAMGAGLVMQRGGAVIARGLYTRAAPLYAMAVLGLAVVTSFELR